MKSPIKVYRLEFRGLGPYQSSCRHLFNSEDKEILEDLLDSHSDENFRPSWNTEFNYSDYSRYHISGCKSIEALKRWFVNFYDDLIAIGFKVKEYVTYHWLEYPKQICFLP